MVISFTSDKTDMHSNSHDIYQKYDDGVPMSAWLPHNKQLIRTKIHKWHIPHHNIFLGYFPMSYVLQKQGIILKILKVAHVNLLGVAVKYHI
jgi:hypothetical protein